MKERQRIREECLKALWEYVRQAQETCKLLADVEGGALTLDHLLGILEQVQFENDLRDTYAALRQKLFNFVGEQQGWEASNGYGGDEAERENRTN
ncbi:MAG TPA: hypothetical protein VFB23_03435 [Candidatus Acidoferrales bacterium]|jgi:hypothetical protein|nr:hypothetical protein [Candidatus Acidoferrales bacterium]